MKTLDEVIEGYERCHGAYGTDESCEYCPLFDICEHDPQMASPWDDDMYHYLKEFQGLSKMWNDKLDKEQENQPLDWETLKQMEGKPVWIEDGLENGEWYIIECFTGSGRFIAHDRYADDTVFKAIDMGNIWQAYRKERS